MFWSTRMGVEMDTKRRAKLATFVLVACSLGLIQLAPSQAATGAQGFPLKYEGAFNCGKDVWVSLRAGYTFRSGPGTKYPIVPNNDDIRYDTQVLARVGDWLDLDGSIDIWVSVRDVYVEVDRSKKPDFDLHDRCLSGVRVKYL